MIRSGMKIAGKSRTTRAVFATDVRFDGLGTTEEDTEQTVQDRPSEQPSTASRERATAAQFGNQGHKVGAVKAHTLTPIAP
jgi:hypothetical protein